MTTFEDVNDFCRLCKENCRIKGRGRVNGWGPRSPPGGFNSAGQGRPFRCAEIPSRDSAPVGLGPRRAHFPRGRCAATGSGSAWKGRGRRWLGAPAPSFTAPLPVTRRFRGPRTKCPLRHPSPRGGTGPPASGVMSTGSDCPQCVPERVAPPGRGPAHVNWRQGSAAMSATHPTRLETRTKESNARASQRVFHFETPWRNESEGRRTPAEVGSRPLGAGRTTGPSRPLRRGGGA